MTFKQILDITGIPSAEIEAHLLSLAHPKVNVLEKKPNSNQLAEEHKFRINPAFYFQIAEGLHSCIFVHALLIDVLPA